ncbi:nitrate reductase subunit alpha [Tessaracoccus sp. ZS01]|uniref:nitrate reductase subunit alpha n=1 Tax=Tessaracoccus sp. ZS01 TaxID=1906324 RepID=UPI00096CA779|nr:nitrate reductase subunit alpha [Tessaracoccus sp. ZS01]MCG6567342.1 nitrate reductase subunit alpha [Tessaracoccus sp. ZS01]OMG57295.1 nitrate reductase subunit alpha [Tessaracoccus sp. ZS01]
MSTDSARLDGPAADALLKLGRYFTQWETTDDDRAVFRQGGREGDVFYRDRWSHDKVVRSTHGVNCTGSCSWKVYVKDGIITWEAQQTDYPTTGPDRPEYEPRGCPRGAAFSWYTYSPTRVRYPYGRGVLIEMYREAKKRLGDPVEAFREISTDPAKRRRYQQARGKGGLVRISWDEALEIAAASYVNTIKNYGPDRVVSFSPIPAMSQVSHAIGTRFTHLIGGAMTSFYDWYADLPVASPQVFGDQTDVPESGDWWDATYLMMWGSNVPVTRTPDAHWMAEVRYRGTKVVTVAPDYADNVKFADEWLPAQAGTDAALAMAMGHVMLKENFVDRQVPYFQDYVKQYTDLGMLITLVEHPNGHGLSAGKFLTAADLPEHADKPDAAFKTVMWDQAAAGPAVPNGSMGFRYNEDGAGQWNLELGSIDPALSLLGQDGTQGVEVALPVFEDPKGVGSIIRRGVPARKVGDHLVTTVFDLMLAQYGVGRDGLPGTWAKGYDDVDSPYTPAWQAEITSVPAEACIRTAREFAQNSEESKGRTMIIIGAGICHWFHADTTYRSIMALLMLTGCIGKNGGGWAHYVGQEKCRPMTGWFNMANAMDWSRPPRTMIGTAYWYMHTDQWRTDGFSADRIKSPLSTGSLDGVHTADAVALSHRLGWMPFYPQFDANPLDLADEAQAAVDRGDAASVQDYVAAKLKSGEIKSSVEDIDAPQNWPRTMILWRSNLFGSSAKGNEYFLKHLLGTHNNVMENQHGADLRPEVVKWHDEAPEGKLDLLITADFRMTSSTLLSDIVFPAATWYEKYDLSSTDMHPYVHAFTPAIDPPWETKSDFDVFAELAIKFSEMAKGRLDTRRDLVAVAMQHDTPGQLAQPGGTVPDWRGTDLPAVPGRNLPILQVVERDYTAIADKLLTVGPLAEELGFTVKNITYDVSHQVGELGQLHGVYPSGPAAGRPAINTDKRLAEAILMFSGTTNGELATQGFRTLEKKTGRRLADLSEGLEERRITFAQTQQAPQPVITSPEWSGSETGGRRYAAFTINVERLKPWHTLSGRMHFFLDHDWMTDAGENLPTFRPPLDMTAAYGEPELGPTGEKQITLRYLTVHNKWSIHSEYQDNLLMLSLGRGGPQAWLSVADAASIGVRDNDWIELTNANGVFVARAVVTPKLPDGVAYVQHAQERTIDVPKSEATGRRGGIHNSVTRILLKATHLIGGYAHQAYAFNYIGPTGVQRDIVSTVRRRSQEVQY